MKNLLAVLIAGLGVLAAPTAATDPTVERLLRRTDDLLRGDSSEARFTMRVKTRRFERSLTMQAWSKGNDKTLAQILAPPKEKGTSTLKVGNNIWNYLPKVDRTIKVPSSMMSGSWMGSHFTNDDLVRASRFADDYECELLERPRGPVGARSSDPAAGHWVIECVPRPEAPVVWGKVVVSVRAGDELVDEVTYWNERGGLIRTMTYEEIGELGGRRLPRLLRVVPAEKPEEFTEIRYDELTFDVDIPDRRFTLQALKP